ncbi:Uncharacterised protein [Lysinibacillus sphaericus]|nr:Uncharacterised protein [Lysinibacillus sphaericus]
MINVSQGLTISIIPEADQVGATAAVKEIAVQDTEGNKAKEGSTVTLAGGNYKYNAALAAGQADLQTVAADKATTNVTASAGETLSAAKTNLTLVAPTTGSAISWASTNPAVSTTGIVTRPIFSAGDATGNLTATITKGTATDTKVFAVTVLKKNFAVGGETVADETFTVTPDGYALADFSAAAGSIEFTGGTTATTWVIDGLTYTLSYANSTGVATVDVTGTATAGTAATTKDITVTKDGKVETVTLSIPAILASDAAATVNVTIQ